MRWLAAVMVVGRGSTCADGEPGPPGELGAQGEQVQAGAPGIDGLPGETGEPGARDAGALRANGEFVCGNALEAPGTWVMSPLGIWVWVRSPLEQP